MKRMMVILALVSMGFVAGCGQGKEPEWRWNLAPLPQQQLITDEQGTRTATVPPDGVIMPEPLAAAPLTVESVKAMLKETAEEMMRLLKDPEKGKDEHTVRMCNELVPRLLKVNESLKNPDCILAHEARKIRDIRAAIRKLWSGKQVAPPLSPPNVVPAVPAVPRDAPVRKLPKGLKA